MVKWESYQKRIMFKGKNRGRCLRKSERCGLRFHKGSFMFRVSMDERRETWINDRKKFYSSISLRNHNLGRKRRGWTMTSILENRKRFDGLVYWGEY